MGTIVALLLALQEIPVEPIVQKGTLYLTSRVADLRKDPEFSLWILLSLDVQPAGSAVRTLLEDALTRPPETTRSAALLAMALELLDPVRYRSRIAHCAQFLLDNQCDDGRWDAGKPVEPPALLLEPPKKPAPRAFNAPALPRVALARRMAGAKTGDSVNSRWAAWGLLACHRSGMDFPVEFLIKAAASWREGEHDPADLVSALPILQSLLQQRNWTKDKDILKAVDRLAIREAPTDPASLFLLRRAMVQFGSLKLGGRDWWQDGVKVLAAAQAPDGGWGSIEDTCFATWYLHIQRK